MRDMILVEHTVRKAERARLPDLLKQLSQAIADLITHGMVEKVIRCRTDFSLITLDSGESLMQALIALPKSMREERSFLLGLVQKCPLGVDLPDSVRSLLTTCEPGKDMGAEELLLCLHLCGLTLSLPISDFWQKHEIEFSYQELDESGELAPRHAKVDNVSIPSHAKALANAARKNKRDELRLNNFNDLCKTCFPHLQFGLDFYDHLQKLGGSLFETLKFKLISLNHDASNWRDGAEPSWSLHVRSESQSVQQNETLKKQRQFRSAEGKTESYFLHADMGDFRLHLRIDSTQRLVEIGYIGPHLGTKKY